MFARSEYFSNMPPRDPHRDRDPADDLPVEDDALGTGPDALDGLERTLADLVEQSWPDDEPLEEVSLDAPTPTGLHPMDQDAATDDDGDDFEPVITQEAPLPDLRADPVVLPWRCTAMVDGVAVPCVADPGEARTALTEPGGHGERAVRLRIAGLVVPAVVQVDDGRPRLRLGRDVLANRFWIAVG